MRTALTPYLAKRAAVKSAVSLSGALAVYDRFTPQNLTGVPSLKAKPSLTMRTPPCLPAGSSSHGPCR